jgi:cytoskeletal protein RodZ
MPFIFMRNFQYDFALLKKTREDKGISKLEMAHQLCLSVNQINSIEEDNFRYFPDECIKLYAIKKYAQALNIDISRLVTVIEDEKSPFKSSQDLPAVISARRYSNKTNYLRQVWKDLLARLLKK